MENIVRVMPGLGLNTTYKKVEILETNEKVGTGWLPPMPDFRDYTEGSTNIPEMTKKLRIEPKNDLGGFPNKVDLREWCSPIENQKSLG